MKPNKQLTLADIARPAHVEQSILNATKGKSKKRNIDKLKAEAHARALEVSKQLTLRTYDLTEYSEFDINERGKDRHIQHLRLFDAKNIEKTDGGLLRAVVDSIEPDVLDYLTDSTHAAIKGHGTHRALHNLQRYLRTDPENTIYCYKADVRHYFPSINRAILKQQLRRLWTDPGVLRVNDDIIDRAPGENGTPIGNHPSQLHANIYLGEFDHWVQNVLNVPYYTRYMDDIVILAGSKEELRRYHREIEWYLRRNLNLELKDNWQIFPVDDRGIDFVGYRIWRNKTLIRKKDYTNLAHEMRRIRYNILTRDKYTKHDEQVLASYMGIASHCTPKARRTLYQMYFKPIFDLLPPASHIDMPGGIEAWTSTQKEHTHRSGQTKKSRRSRSGGHSYTSTRTSATNQKTKRTQAPKDIREFRTSRKK